MTSTNEDEMCWIRPSDIQMKRNVRIEGDFRNTTVQPLYIMYGEQDGNRAGI